MKLMKCTLYVLNKSWDPGLNRFVGLISLIETFLIQLSVDFLLFVCLYERKLMNELFTRGNQFSK